MTSVTASARSAWISGRRRDRERARAAGGAQSTGVSVVLSRICVVATGATKGYPAGRGLHGGGRRGGVLAHAREKLQPGGVQEREIDPDRADALAPRVVV